MESQSLFQVREHGGINPETESPRLVAKHLSAYHFAKDFARGRTLEIGCGDGYGSSLLSNTAEEVIGIDLFERNVEVASAKYDRPNLKFLRMNATELAFPEKSFDLAVSFQVIEHIPQALLNQYLNEIKRVLKINGVACISTLNLKKNLKAGQTYDKSPHHDKEFLPFEFEDLLKSHFRQVAVYGLYPTSKHLFFERLKKAGFGKMPAPLNPVARFYDHITARDFYWSRQNNLDDCIDLLAVCRN